MEKKKKRKKILEIWYNNQEIEWERFKIFDFLKSMIAFDDFKYIKSW